ncbi:poly-gamma-glutamate hydrolase family protein [Shimia thalassica]|uniref:poly-gamma-glutamate hydrolase family protein n=1 Tax=Shimia thalassica TaxID=1715693 RepID=UPI001C091729|nr:poly-gamma-glutamate hydrolase family protein [Shimia thalassica]MBU2942217.1 poly-gamma-glutamate hydrolase family protein [Shimia thalassica]MDO6502813.1 poly-gamma-glutamate hydrolase family protein [Shimia thalassica]
MADKYEDFKELDAENTDGKDYRIISNNRDSTKCVIAPHGGKIEKATSEIAKLVAGDAFGLYLFEGIKTKANIDLHITSTNFDEPKFDRFIKKHTVALGIHGRKDKAEVKGNCIEDKETIYLGGLNKNFVELIQKNLNERNFNTLSEGHLFLARRGENVCNRTDKQGAQIEIPLTLRENLLADERLMSDLCEALRMSLTEA